MINVEDFDSNFLKLDIISYKTLICIAFAKSQLKNLIVMIIV